MRLQIAVFGSTWRATIRLLELLTHVALSATKAGVDVGEPLCHVTYRHEGVTSDVTLTLRIADVRIDSAKSDA